MFAWIKKLGHRLGFEGICAISLTVLIFSLIVYAKEQETQKAEVGISAPEARWVIYQGPFTGYKTKQDASKIDDGASPNGQNTVINDGDRVSIRDFGYEMLPASSTASSTTNGITSLHTFKKRNGENVMIRSHGTQLEYYEKANGLWETIATSSISGLKYGFADFNINTDLISFTYFGNGTDSFKRWNGGHSLTNGVVAGGAGSIIVDSTTGFSSTGTIIYCDTPLPYTALTATTFTVSSAHSCGDNRGVAQYPQAYPAADYPRGNIYATANNRLFITGIASTSEAVYFSRYADARDFTSAGNVTDNTDTAPGIFNLSEGGGAVTGIALDENSIYFLKKNSLTRATLTDTLYTLTALKPYDGKSSAVGAIGSDSVFTGGNGVFFITSDNQIMNLNRIANVDFPQVTPISDIIKPTISNLVLTSSTGIFFKNRAWFGVRSSESSGPNDTILLYNNKQQAWESPVVGLNPAVFAIYDDGGGVALYFGDSRTANVWKITDTPVDNGLGVTASWRSKQFNFGLQAVQKEIESVFVEGYISDNTTLTLSLLLDEEGFSQISTTEFKGTETDYIYSAPLFNLFGLTEFATQRFGANDDTTGKKKFRVYLEKSLRRNPFYIAQLEVASDSENAQWEITSFGFRVREHSQPQKTKLLRLFQ